MIVLEKIDGLLNSITMYRLVLYGLAVLAAIAVIFGFLGILPYSGFQFIQTLALILITCFLANNFFAKIVNADSNVESFWITASILFLVLAPVAGRTDLIVTVLISVVAMASKYFLTFNKKHIFNPAAIAMFLAGLFGYGNSIWWVGSFALLPYVAVVGFLIVRKIRRFQLFFTFIVAGILSISLFNYLNNLNVFNTLTQALSSWPLIFFGSIMLTEPFTSPPNKRYRVVYGMIVGFLFGSQFSFGPLFASPELALIAGNIFSFIVSPKGKLILKFKEKVQLAPTIYEFKFMPNSKFAFIPGQYMEWTLPDKNPDARGIRRYFTIASSPEENDVKLGVKIIPDKSSSFKKALLNLKPGTKLTADQLSGDFVIQKNEHGNLVFTSEGRKLCFIAGGIGITPFRSMVSSIIDSGKKIDTVLFYSAAEPKDFVYKEIFKKAADNGIKTVYVLGGKNPPPQNWTGEIGFLTEEMVKKYAPDFKERIFYLSGPIAMVNNYKNLLHGLGIGYSKIVTDYFPGF